VVNRSINQTLSRTVLTSGLTFLTVLSLYIFGGPVLRGFQFALVVGILIGTYSSIAVAAPMLVAWQEWRAGQRQRSTLPAQGIEAVVLPAAKPRAGKSRERFSGVSQMELAGSSCTGFAAGFACGMGCSDKVEHAPVVRF
jgi:hypothetical protein